MGKHGGEMSSRARPADYPPLEMESNGEPRAFCSSGAAGGGGTY